MRNERGFFTIVGLCLLMAVAISIRGVQEFEGNYSIGASNAQAEHELQNAADSALVEMIETGSYTKKFTSKRLGKISVEVSRLAIKDSVFKIEYVHTENGKRVEKSNEVPDRLNKGVVWISVASCKNPVVGGKIYRRSRVYVLEDDPETEFDESKVTYFLNDWQE